MPTESATSAARSPPTLGQLLDVAARDHDFELPDCGDVRSITPAGLGELSTIIAAYQQFLITVRDTDPVSHQLVTGPPADPG